MILKAAFASKEQLAFTLTHELGHVIFLSNPELAKLAMEKALSGLLDTEGHVNIQYMTQELIRLNNWTNISGQNTNWINTAKTPILNNSIEKLVRIIKF